LSCAKKEKPRLFRGGGHYSCHEGGMVSTQKNFSRGRGGVHEGWICKAKAKSVGQEKEGCPHERKKVCAVNGHSSFHIQKKKGRGRLAWATDGKTAKDRRCRGKERYQEKRQSTEGKKSNSENLWQDRDVKEGGGGKVLAQRRSFRGPRTVGGDRRREEDPLFSIAIKKASSLPREACLKEGGREPRVRE